MTITRREAGLGLALGLAAAAALPPSAAASQEVTEAEARAVLDPWAEALFTGDPAQVAETLAPEFQVLRSNGVGQGKEDYLQALPKKAKRNVFSEIVATRGGEVLVLRYLSEADQVILGATVKGVAPRLSVFRQAGGRWLMVAHANFAPLGSGS